MIVDVVVATAVAMARVAQVTPALRRGSNPEAPMDLVDWEGGEIGSDGSRRST
jgi:hypothetical protein